MANLPIDGQRVALKHTSPLAKAQDLDDLFSLERMQQSVPPEALVLGVKLEELGTYVARKMGIDPALIRPEAEKRPHCKRRPRRCWRRCKRRRRHDHARREWRDPV
jgi:hypothetical protein